MAVIFETQEAFERAAIALFGDWLPIDYGQADSGKGCFDGRQYILKLNDGLIVVGYFCQEEKHFMDFVSGWWFVESGEDASDDDPDLISIVTHYRPIPTGWIGGV